MSLTRLTLVTVGAHEARITEAGEVARRLAPACAPGPAHIGGDVPHLRRVVGRHGDGAAVNRCKKN